jgi:diphthamide biosynthesis methyltransferase
MNIKEQIEEILLTDYQYVDCYTVQKLLDLFAVIKSLPDSDEIRMKARELDEKDFAQWMHELQKGNVL